MDSEKIMNPAEKNEEKLIARAMTFSEFERFLEYSDELETSNTPAKLIGVRMARWVAKNIYNIDPDSAKYTPGTIMDLLVKTQALSEKSELEDLKN
jgi:hypothetical protein